jgi:hypothetical protein
LRRVTERVVASDRRDRWHFVTFEASAPTAFEIRSWLDLDDEPCTGVLWGSGPADTDKVPAPGAGSRG